MISVEHHTHLPLCLNSSTSSSCKIMLCVAGAITMDPFSLPQATFPWDGMYMVEVIANGWLFSSHWK